MNRPICCKYRLLRLCLFLLLMLSLTGRGARRDSHLRWVTYSETGAPLDTKEVIAAANAVSEGKIGVTVNLEFQPPDKINLMMASGEYYDIVFTCAWTNDFDKNAEAGLYYDITDLVQKETPALYQSIGKYWDCAKINGRIMGIPIPYDQESEIPQAMALWDCEKVMDRYRTLHRWYKAGYIHPDAATIDSTAADKSFPVRFGVAWKGYMGYSNPADWGFHVKTPTYEGPFISRQSEQGAMFGICAACSEERVIECLKYIELLSTDRKFRDILAYGIEGKHFEYLDNGTVLTTRTGADRYATRLYQTGSFVNASVASISRDILADPDQWEKVFEEYDTEGIYSKTHGFHYSESRKESIITALQAIFGDYSTELRTGTSDPDVVIPKMRAYGGSRV